MRRVLKRHNRRSPQPPREGHEDLGNITRRVTVPEYDGNDPKICFYWYGMSDIDRIRFAKMKLIGWINRQERLAECPTQLRASR